ncbi:hypothetical protein SLEP1_g30606 [Rubroshorea leprosula]|uniref:glutathione transferase n=1 Tax=Rubroshorea leprosula TaxID=152421 RepID=A0AAV5KAJ7_9ROSI|nr:hypothetical protein SLEP1_g30606 [Rubroshorea leprosula]
MLRIAMEEKGIDYESKQEDFFDKSRLLLEMNPIHKKVPVLVHNGRPICELLIILQYMDEVWDHKAPLLPSDPYQQSQAGFRPNYSDKKIYETGRRICTAKQDQEEAKKQFIGCLETLEGELGNKFYFGGESSRLVDVVLLPYTSWFYTYETFGNFKIEEKCPKIIAWANRCKERKSVSKNLADLQKIYDFMLQYQRRTRVV